MQDAELIATQNGNSISCRREGCDRWTPWLDTEGFDLDKDGATSEISRVQAQ